MARRDEGQNVRSDLGFRNTVFAFGIESLQQMGQQVVGRLVRLLGQDPAAGGYDPIDLRFEKLQRRAHQEPAEPRDEVGYAEKVERTDFPYRVEIGHHGGPDLFGIGSKSIREDRAFDHVQRDPCHLGRDIDCCVVPTARPALDQNISGSHHRGCKIHHGLARKYRRNDAPLQTPLLALGAQQSIIQPSRQHPALQAILPIICCVIEQDAADRVRLVNQEHVPDGQSAGNDRLLEVLCGPAFQRVALQGADQSDRLQRARLRLRRRRTIRGFRERSVAVFQNFEYGRRPLLSADRKPYKRLLSDDGSIRYPVRAVTG